MLRDLLSRDIGLSGLNNPNVPLYQALTDLFDAPAVDAGVTVNEQTAMRITTVYACVDLIAETIASLPLKTYSGDGDDRREIKLAGERYIWDAPNPEMTKQFFWECIVAAILLNGNAYINTARTESGAIGELWPIHPATVQVGRDRSGAKVYEIQGDRTRTATDITHIPGFGTDGLLGLSVVGQARQSLGVSIAAERFAARLFGSGSLPGGILKTGATLNEDQAKALKARWKSMHSGINKSWDIAVLDGGADFMPLTIPPEDAQFLETRQYQAGEIAGLFRVPPHLVGLVDRSTSWGTGIEQQNIQFVNYRLRPLAHRLEQTITRDLLPTKPRYAKFNLDGLLRGDTAARVAYYSAGRKDGWLNVDEIRHLEDRPSLPDGQGQTYQQTPTGATPNETGDGNGDDQTA